MKKTLFMICATLVFLASCNTDLETVPPEEKPVVVTFNLKVNHPNVSTKAVKTGWEINDVVFVFFSGQSSPAYLELKWDGTSWGESNHGLSLTEGEQGSMRAIFLPFGSAASVSVEETDKYKFSDTYYSYYLTSLQPYSVTEGTVSGTFDMQIPEGFVQFFIDNEDASANDVIELREPHLTPISIASIDKDGNIEEAALAHGAPMPGYVYEKTTNKTDNDSKGYLFSGILASETHNTPTDYHFTLVRGGFTGNYYYKDFAAKSFYRSASEGRAIKLPVPGNWTAISDYKPIDLGTDIEGKRVYWSSRNLGATAEAGTNSCGDYYAWGETSPYYSIQSPLVWKSGKGNGYKWESYSMGDGTTFSKYTGSDYTTLQPEDDAARSNLHRLWRMPTAEEWAKLLAACSWSWQADYQSGGLNGYLVTNEVSGNYVFVPTAGYYGWTSHNDVGSYGNYWSSTLSSSNVAKPWRVCFNAERAWSDDTGGSRFHGFTIRPVTD